ncbi:MAG TPA: polysaccharide biosynthesis tyrosine autokinase [Steroidobacteraceae bacterium]|nr:polysaccharide biosynthesis tyrosine autokinase [Steroidobacteraceae bacterium]
MKVTEQVVEIDGTVRPIGQAPDRRIGTILRHANKLAGNDIEQVLNLQNSSGLRFGEAALRLGLVTAGDLRGALAQQYDLPQLATESDRINSELVVAAEPLSRSAEQIRALRTQLLIRWSGEGPACRMLAIVSPGRHDGRSYLVANLAVAFAQLGRRTLLIDGDLRRPRQQQIFGVADKVGLSSVLSGRAGREAAVPLPEFGPLALLPAGAPPPNPVELLSRDAFQRLLFELAQVFEVILFDTPPARVWADAQSVAFRAGSVLMLARRNHTRLADTTRLTRQLADAGAQTVGTVCNEF